MDPDFCKKFTNIQDRVDMKCRNALALDFTSLTKISFFLALDIYILSLSSTV